MDESSETLSVMLFRPERTDAPSASCFALLLTACKDKPERWACCPRGAAYVYPLLNVPMAGPGTATAWVLALKPLYTDEHPTNALARCLGCSSTFQGTSYLPHRMGFLKLPNSTYCSKDKLPQERKCQDFEKIRTTKKV